MNFNCMLQLVPTGRTLGSRRKSTRPIQIERLEQRAMMSVTVADVAVLDADAEPAAAPRPSAIGERFPGTRTAPEAARDNPVGIAPLPTPYPNPDWVPSRDDLVAIDPLPTPRPRPVDEILRIGIAPLPTPYPDPDWAPARDDLVGIAPLPSPHPRPEDKASRVGIEPNPTPHPRPISREALATVMSSFASTRNDLVGIAPLPTPHPRPADAVSRIGVIPIPTA